MRGRIDQEARARIINSAPFPNKYVSSKPTFPGAGNAMISKFPPKSGLEKTPEGQSWLRQFHNQDVHTAELLLKSLYFVSSEYLSLHLKLMISDILASATGKISLYVSREVEIDASKKKIPFFPSDTVSPAAFPASTAPGSEGGLAHLCRDIAKGSKGKILFQPSIEQMKLKKCKALVIVDDIAGSGKRLCEFARWIRGNKSVRSWTSYKKATIVAVSYAATQRGQARIRRSSLIEELHFAQNVVSGRTWWTDEQRRQIVDLCKKYAPFTSRKDLPLGYKDTFSLILFSHNCPNNTPAILWAGKKNSWEPLFPNRTRPDVSIGGWADLIDKKSTESTTENRLTKVFGEESDDVSRILGFLATRKLNENLLSDLLGRPLPYVRRLLGTISNLDLYKAGRLTPAGRETLRLVNAAVIKGVSEIDRSSEFYYPMSLRSPD